MSQLRSSRIRRAELESVFLAEDQNVLTASTRIHIIFQKTDVDEGLIFRGQRYLDRTGRRSRDVGENVTYTKRVPVADGIGVDGVANHALLRRTAHPDRLERCIGYLMRLDLQRRRLVR